MGQKKHEDGVEAEEEELVVKQFRSYMTRRYILGLLVIALLASISYFFLSYVVKLQEDNATVINISGRQRMFSQRIALHAELLISAESEAKRQDVRENLRRAIRMMENSHQGLIHGNTTMSLPGIRSKAIRDIYYQAPYDLDKKVDDFLDHARTLLVTPASELSLQNTHQKALLKEASKEILDTLNKAVDQYEKEAQSHVIRLQKLAFFIYALTLLVLACLVFFVFAPMVSHITRKYREAYHTSRSKSYFLATMSHEIRTPMNGIIGSTELLLNGNLGDNEIRNARAILYSAEALLDVINDVLNFSKIETGRIALEEAPFNMEILAENSIHSFVLRAQDKKIELIMRYVPGTPEFLTGDAGRVRQVIFNIVGNAIKFSDEGYILITIEKTYPRNRRNPGKCWLKISIEDTGIGIPEDKQTIIFDKFTQVDSSSSRAYGGTGLGLSICKRLVEMMDGEIGVESTIGEGSTFWFAVPFMVSPSHKEERVAQKILKDLKVLIVDEDESNCKLIMEQLSHAGVNCVACASGKDALVFLRDATKKDEPFQLGVFACFMPDIDGELLACQVKSESGTIENLPLVALTPSVERGYVQRFSRAGFSEILIKPTQQSQVLDTISYVVDAFNKGHRKGLFSVEDNMVSGKEVKLTGQTEDDKDLSGLVGKRILLVEDNSTNRMMAQEMLEDMQCIVAVAEDGSKAVDAVEKQVYDLILMDCQMPVMDGFEATRRIRSKESTDRLFSHIPIVAVTANAMKGDREKCIASGMDDYLAKPLRTRMLQKVLGKWLIDDGIEESMEQQEKNEVEGASEIFIEEIQQTSEEVEVSYEGLSLLDEKILSNARKMMKARFFEIVKLYLRDAAENIEGIRRGIEENDSGKVASASCTIKSSSGQLGAILVSEIAKDIEANASNTSGDMTIIIEKLDSLVTNFEKTEADLKRYMDSHSGL